MRISLACVVAITCWSLDSRADEPVASTYPQLIATKYPTLPAEVRKPEPDLSWVDRSKLPAGAEVRSAAKSAGGVFWVVTDQGSFRSTDDGKYTRLDVGPRHPEPGQPPVRALTVVHAVAADRLGHVWVATTRGLFATDGNEWWQPLDRRAGVPFEDVTCLHLAPDGAIWAGSSQGAWRLKDGEFRAFAGRRWLPDDRVRSIWTDAAGKAWIETAGGYASVEERSMTLEDKAAYFDGITQDRHLRRGFVAELRLKKPGDLSGGSVFEVSDNDGLWTAVYAAAMSFRFAATKDAQARAQAKVAIDALLELERLSGIPGYPARAVVTEAELAAGAEGVNLEGKVRVPGEEERIWYRSPVDPDVWCKGDTSSDELDGHYFAWYAYHELAADETEKKRIAGIVKRVTDHILDHDYTLVGHTGRRTRWGIWTPALINGDPFYHELRPLNSLEMLCFLKIAEHVTGEARYSKVYDELIEKHHFLLNTLMMRRGRSGRWDAINHSDDQLLYMCYYPLLMLERDPDRRRVLLQSMARTWEPSISGEQTLKDEGNPLYNAIYGATSARPCDVEGALRTLRDWPWDPLHWTVDNRMRSDVRIRTELGNNGARRPTYDRVLPASERRLHRWNGSPWAADGGDEGRTEDDCAAWSLGYWIGVRHGLWR